MQIKVRYNEWLGFKFTHEDYVSAEVFAELQKRASITRTKRLNGRLIYGDITKLKKICMVRDDGILLH